RYYDPASGVFTSADPIGSPGSGQNLYGYVGGNPVNFVDPSGLFLWGVGDAIVDGGEFLYDNAGTIAQIGATVTCIVASAGACVLVAGGLLAASAVSNIYDAASKRQCIKGALGDFGRDTVSTALSTIPGARMVYGGGLAKYGANRAGEWALKSTGAIPGFGLGQSTSMALGSSRCGC
ncbi:MAG: RHS repeat-associated core domain-containing protein, partial [Thermoleophilaceae bacterium]|nr:RHS repeat-associated core domain-containing protein [Thermoleophilaceae bacterium]